MREIKFRGYNKTFGWRYGDYKFTRLDEMPEIYHDGYPYVVDIVSIGQFTGLYDKNGKEIYEGDLVQVLDYASWEGLYKVIWDEESLMYVLEDAYGDKEKMCEFEHYLVRGNIYENPELLD